MSVVQFVGPSGLNLYAAIVASDGQWWNNTTVDFEAFAADQMGSYAIVLSETAATGVYSAQAPAGLPTGSVVALYRRRTGTFASVDDANLAAETLSVGESTTEQIAHDVAELLQQTVGVTG